MQFCSLSLLNLVYLRAELGELCFMSFRIFPIYLWIVLQDYFKYNDGPAVAAFRYHCRFWTRILVKLPAVLLLLTLRKCKSSWWLSHHATHRQFIQKVKIMIWGCGKKSRATPLAAFRLRLITFTESDAKVSLAVSIRHDCHPVSCFIFVLSRRIGTGCGDILLTMLDGPLLCRLWVSDNGKWAEEAKKMKYRIFICKNQSLTLARSFNVPVSIGSIWRTSIAFYSWLHAGACIITAHDSSSGLS